MKPITDEYEITKPKINKLLLSPSKASSILNQNNAKWKEINFENR